MYLLLFYIFIYKWQDEQVTGRMGIVTASVALSQEASLLLELKYTTFIMSIITNIIEIYHTNSNIWCLVIKFIKAIFIYSLDEFYIHIVNQPLL